MMNCLKCLANKLVEEVRTEVRENKNVLVRTISCRNNHVLEIVEDEAGFMVFSSWLESKKLYNPEFDLATEQFIDKTLGNFEERGLNPSQPEV